MKKLLITVGLLLFAAVFMSGCITETPSDDPLVGIWQDVESKVHGYVFNADGAGYFFTIMGDGLVSGNLDLTWKNNGDGTYTVTMTDTKGIEMPQTTTFELKDGKLTLPTPRDGNLEFIPATLEEYAVGLWTGIRGDYKEYTDIQILLYLGADGKGNAVVYGPEVLNLDEIFTAEFTWKAVEDKVVLTGANGGDFELYLVNDELVFATIYPLHKYTIPDHLYGLWESAEPYVENGVSYDIVEVIKSDGTGVEIWTVPGSDKASFRYTFTWEMTSSTTYKAVYDDGEVWLFETSLLQLFDGETTYNKVGFDVLQEYAENKVTA